MFTVFDIGPWVIEADAAKTRKQYEKPWGRSMRLRELPEFLRGDESPSRRENKIVYAVWDSSVCLSRLRGDRKGKRPASLCGQLSDCRPPWRRLA
ncbi:hypothetical protein BARD7_03388 [Bacillus amyloliquefaciens]|nr:hypothetical protein BARD7_03388 [Bacillus amyloliquefaciens]